LLQGCVASLSSGAVLYQARTRATLRAAKASGNYRFDWNCVLVLCQRTTSLLFFAAHACTAS
jgi:hypothetical protein